MKPETENGKSEDKSEARRVCDDYRASECGEVDAAEPVCGTKGGDCYVEAPDNAEPGTSLPAALQSKLGLKLEKGKGPVEVLVIDHIEKPSEN